MELWEDIYEFPRYAVSNQGRVMNVDTQRILRMGVNGNGVVFVGMMQGNVQVKRAVALLVAKAFLLRPRDPFDTPIHLNGDKTDSRADNLEWRPRWFAIKYHQQFAQPSVHAVYTPVEVVNTGEMFEDTWRCSIAHGLLQRDLVLSILNNTFAFPTYYQYRFLED